MTRPIVLLAAWAVLSACDMGEEAASETAPVAGTPLAVDADPRLSVGVLEGDPMQEFHRVVTPFLLPGGELVVPVSDARAIRVFGADGGPVTELGRRGEGPGEFASLGAAWARGDTIEAFDGGLLRITRFLPEGGHEVVTLDPVPSAQSAVPGPLPDGWAVMGVASAGMDRRDEMVVHHFSRDGTHLGEVARLEGMLRYQFPGGGGGAHPLSPRARAAVAGGRIYLADTEEPRVRRIDPSGAVEEDVAWEVDSGPSPDAALRAVVDAAVARARPGEGEGVRQRLESALLPEEISVFWDVLVDAEGFLWIRPYEPTEHAFALGATPTSGPGAGGEWLVLTAEGERVGTVTVPDGLEPLHITSDAVVGIHRDEWDVESVRVHELWRSAGS